MPQTTLIRRLLDAYIRNKRARKPEKFFKPIVDLNNQSRQLEVGYAIFVNPITFQDGSRICSFMRSDEIIRALHSDTTTLFEAVRRGARKSNNGPMLGSRNQEKAGKPYEWLSYNEVIDSSVDLAHGFQKLGLSVGQDTCIGIYSKNRPEWIIVEHATYTFNNVLIPLYDTFTADVCAYVM
jgi:long-chain acyl-CoA synthetase